MLLQTNQSRCNSKQQFILFIPEYTKTLNLDLSGAGAQSPNIVWIEGKQNPCANPCNTLHIISPLEPKFSDIVGDRKHAKALKHIVVTKNILTPQRCASWAAIIGKTTYPQ